MAWGTITWWGIANIAIHLDGLDLGFDPYLYPKAAPLDYIFITHEHYDHLDEPTLRPLVQSPHLKMLLVPKSAYFASRLHYSTQEPKPSDLAWADRHRAMVFYPQITPPGVRYDGPSEVRLGRLHVVGVSSGEVPEEWADRTPLSEPFPTVGYVVTDQETGLSFYHPGDITDAFDELARLQGTVTYLFLPIGKLNGAEGRMVKLVQPKYVIPIHYRLDTPDWPIPLTVKEKDIHYVNWRDGQPAPGVTFDDTGFWNDIPKLINGRWYPTPRDPMGFLRDLHAEIGDIAQIVLLQAGRTYKVDAQSGAIENATIMS